VHLRNLPAEATTANILASRESHTRQSGLEVFGGQHRYSLTASSRGLGLNFLAKP